jgi:hypothetical protein
LPIVATIKCGVDIEQHIASIAALAKVSKSRASRKLVSIGFGADEAPVGAGDTDFDAGSEVEGAELTCVEKRFEVEIVKASDEEQTVSGVVLQPEVVDAQGDIMSAEVIKEAAYGFLQGFNKSTKIGLQHSTFPKGKLALVESYVAPNGVVIGAKTVRQGSWVMTVKVLDAAIWKKVKDGKITGFSIGGRAKVVTVDTDNED